MNEELDRAKSEKKNKIQQIYFDYTSKLERMPKQIKKRVYVYVCFLVSDKWKNKKK